MSTILTLEEIIEKVRPVLVSYGIKDAAVFGSYAKGTQTYQSDVDIYVDSGLQGLAFFGLLDDIVNALPLRVDLIDRHCITPGGPLDLEIKKTGKRIPLC